MSSVYSYTIMTVNLKKNNICFNKIDQSVKCFVWPYFCFSPSSLAEGYGGRRIPSTGQCRHQRGFRHWHWPNLLGLASDDCAWDQRRVALLWDWQKGPGEWLRVGGGGHTWGHGGGHSNDHSVPELLPSVWNPLGTQIWTGALWEETLLPGKKKTIQSLAGEKILPPPYGE